MGQEGEWGRKGKLDKRKGLNKRPIIRKTLIRTSQKNKLNIHFIPNNLTKQKEERKKRNNLKQCIGNSH